MPLSLSTLAHQIGAGAAALTPLFKRLEAHVLTASRLHGDDTTVPVLAKGKTDTGRLWPYVRDDRPFGGVDPPAAVFYYSRDRRGEHPAAHLAGWSGILQMPLAVMAISMRRVVSRRLFWKPAAGPTGGAKCSSWPISKRRRARRRAARSPTWSIR